jgi:hypothetical protein
MERLEILMSINKHGRKIITSYQNILGIGVENETNPTML